jgi:hypothetical protein
MLGILQRFALVAVRVKGVLGVGSGPQDSDEIVEGPALEDAADPESGGGGAAGGGGDGNDLG